MRILQSLLIGMIVLFPHLVDEAKAGEGDGRLPVHRLAHAGKALHDFLPAGWIVEEQAAGDLNGDGASDLAAILVQSKPEFDKDGIVSDRQRGLIVLLAGRKGFTLAGVNDELLQCTTCGGVKEGVSINIRKGVIILSQLSGSREFTDETWRFRYEPGSRRFILIGRDTEYGDSILGTGTTKSINCLTGRTVSEMYRYDAEGSRRISLSKKTGSVPRNTPFLEDVTLGQ
jgi:hypothetical protein